MSKLMGNGDVLRCLAKHLIYRPVRPGKYQCDASCDRICVEFNNKNDLCLRVREAINELGIDTINK